MSAEEKIGRAVLFPVKSVVGLACVVVLLGLYPCVAFYVFCASKGSIKERLKTAVRWPLGILALNEFMSLGGFNSPRLSRLTERIARLSNRNNRHKKKRSNRED